MALSPLPASTELNRGRFVIERTLAAGGFGITYVAIDREFGGDRCVVKELAIDELSSRESDRHTVAALPDRADLFERWKQRFFEEALTLSRIRHAGVVGVRSVWGELGTMYYAMDFIDGAPLQGPDEGTVSWPEAERIARALLDALDAVHDRGITHGDLKPDNVIVQARDGRLTLIDFGTSRSNDELRKTATSFAFTAGYAPLELMSRSDRKAAGPWSDLYSWAVIVTSLVLRHDTPDGWPLDAATRSAIVTHGGRDPWAELADRLEGVGVPAAWAGTLVSCLALEPEHRPRTCAEVSRSISASGHRGEARTPSTPSGEMRRPLTRGGEPSQGVGAARSGFGIDPHVIAASGDSADPTSSRTSIGKVSNSDAPPTWLAPAVVGALLAFGAAVWRSNSGSGADGLTATASSAAPPTAASAPPPAAATSPVVAPDTSAAAPVAQSASAEHETIAATSAPTAVTDRAGGQERRADAGARTASSTRGTGAGAPAAPERPTHDFVATPAALYGTWNADFPAMLASQEMSEEERAMATAMLGSAQMALTFRANGTMVMNGVMMGQTQTESGTWSVVSAEANTLRITATTATAGSEPQAQAMFITFVSGTSCWMTDGSEGSQSIPFNKAR